MSEKFSVKRTGWELGRVIDGDVTGWRRHHKFPVFTRKKMVVCYVPAAPLRNQSELTRLFCTELEILNIQSEQQQQQRDINLRLVDLYRPRNDLQPRNDPQTGPEMTPALKLSPAPEWSPNWTRNNPGAEMIPNLTRNYPQPLNDPQTGPEMIPALKWSPTGPEMIPKLDPKLSPNWTRNDPQTGPKMIPKLDPKWPRPRNDPEVNLGTVWRPSDRGWTLNFFSHIYFNDNDKNSNNNNDNFIIYIWITWHLLNFSFSKRHR